MTPDIRRAAQRLAKGGVIDSAVPGRTDKIAGKLEPGSYVIPADIVSALGEGNTAAGAEILDDLTDSGAWGESGPRAAVDPFRSKPADVIVAGGEYVVTAAKVAIIGGGDKDRGHDILDRFVKKVRAHAIETLKSLPGPKT